ncbi:MAG: aquaporin [Actinomycetota bacterium]
MRRSLNRAVTFSMAVRGRLPWREIIPYVIAQLAGAVLGGLLIVATFGRGVVGTAGWREKGPARSNGR